MTKRYLIKVCTLSRGDMWYSEQSPNKLDFRLPYAKRFPDEQSARIAMWQKLPNRCCHIVQIDA